MQKKDINMEDVNVSLNYYRGDSLLFLQARIINHSTSIIIVTPLQFNLLAGNTMHPPERLQLNGAKILNKNTFMAYAEETAFSLNSIMEK